MGIAPVLAITGQKFPRQIEGYFEFFAVFGNVYVFNPCFLAESRKMLCETAAGKHCIRLAVSGQLQTLHVQITSTCTPRKKKISSLSLIYSSVFVQKRDLLLNLNLTTPILKQTSILVLNN
jgi:hypothetical protein